MSESSHHKMSTQWTTSLEMDVSLVVDMLIWITTNPLYWDRRLKVTVLRSWGTTMYNVTSVCSEFVYLHTECFLPSALIWLTWFSCHQTPHVTPGYLSGMVAVCPAAWLVSGTWSWIYLLVCVWVCVCQWTHFSQVQCVYRREQIYGSAFHLLHLQILFL